MFGSHLSIAGGLHNALLDARRLSFETVQIFTKNQQQWVGKPLTPEIIATFREHATRLSYPVIVAHDSYLINLATQDDAKWQQAKGAFSEEMRRCDLLGVKYLVTHPGAHVGAGEEAGIARVVRAYNEIMREHAGKHAPQSVTVCLETTAGQGSCLGWRFEHLAEMLRGMEHPERFGVCVDTAHLLAAGYDITTADGMRRVLDEFDRVVGLQHLKVMHLNDSKKALGTRVDRHDHIGRGFVGLGAFEAICRDERFADVPKILETPKDSPTPRAEDGREWDVVNADLLRRLAKGEKVAAWVAIVQAEETKHEVTKSRKVTKGKTATKVKIKMTTKRKAGRKSD